MTDSVPTFQANTMTASLTMKDVEKSVAFYRDVLGFAAERRYEREGRLMGVGMRAGNVWILLNQDDGAKGWDRAKGEGFSLQFVTDQDIDALARRIQEAGGTLDTEPADMPWGARMFRLRDLDGYKLTFSSDVSAKR